MKLVTIEVKGRYMIEEINLTEVRLITWDYLKKYNDPSVIYLSHNNAIKLSQICSGLIVTVCLVNTFDTIRLNIIRDISFNDTEVLIL